MTVKSSYEKNDFKIYDESLPADKQIFDWTTDPLMPRLDITKFIEVLGDYENKNYTDFRTYSRLTLRADYQKMELEAMEETIKYFRDFEASISSGDGEFEQYECADAEKKRN